MSPAALAHLQAAPTDPITAPALDLVPVMPVMIVLGAACLGVLVEAFAPRAARYPVQLLLTVAALLGAGAWTVWAGAAEKYTVTFSGSVAVDRGTLVTWGVLLALALPSVLLIADRVSEPGGAFAAQASAPAGSSRDRRAMQVARPMQTEVFPLALFAVGGMLVFPAASDVLTLFVGLEVLSLPLYLLCGLARRRRLISQEAAVKYFLLGAFTSAILLYGLGLLYGYAGSLRFSAIAEAQRAGGGNDVLLLAGLGLLTVGLLFKASVGPFHLWTPDVYQGAPTPVTAFMAACTKVAAFAAMVRVFQVVMAPMSWSWQPVLWVVAIASMLIGSIIGIAQSDMKRVLAYSSVAHAGFILLGVMSLSERGVSGTMYYLLTYGFATIGAFAIITLIRRGDGEASQLSDWAGLARRAPVLAGAMALFLLSFAGIPLTSGFIGKLSVFTAAVDAGMTPLVVVAMVATAITAFFYLKVIVVMYFTDPAGDPAPDPVGDDGRQAVGEVGPDGWSAPSAGGPGPLRTSSPQVSTPVLAAPYIVVPGLLTGVVIGVSVAVTILLGVLPSAVLDVLSVPLPLLS
ncbi:NADH-quinone oxidoreductase subunit NuoN [Nakamurella flavida]|uniref:NADH-quinone oxidoreductase subunit N n=1 Tax=Nakamurella flavida TaxID=363630 RepID=A0A938YMX3_9ACTN|nr:NADH-quinone oxidoreductase subunit NuoN [Nakamurella flavida]MBM9475825.1 NADH-quinone oxidoreductase subunit NuoN [Nakamurella flavida]MDP9777892.1 NADH-quinone oxidoreductase subunit N [Nakamurella flavida]